jgi:uncharacterized membrane protein YphA (DoxX/SURF4 family)
MNQNIATVRKNAERFVFNVFSVYVIFHVLFISDYSPLIHLNFVGIKLVSWVNSLFIHKNFRDFIPTADSYWAYLATLIFFILAILTTPVWLAIDKRKSVPAFYEFTYIIARYFVAFELFGYGISKLDGLQFYISPERLLPFVGADDPFNLFWITMGASKVYAFFGGLLETAAGILFLFRRTTTLGCLIAIPVLLNVVMTDISWDIIIKLKAFHMLVFCVFILTPDINGLYRFLILKQNSSLSASHPRLVDYKKFYGLQYVLKFLIIGYILYSIIRDDVNYYTQMYYSPYQKLIGVFNVNQFHTIKNPGIINDIDSLKWKKVAVSHMNGIQVLLMNDSIAGFFYTVDTKTSSIEMTAFLDSTNKAKLHYVESKTGDWQFEGIYHSDSIHFSATKIDMNTLPLLKDKGKIKWTYD